MFSRLTSIWTIKLCLAVATAVTAHASCAALYAQEWIAPGWLIPGDKLDAGRRQNTTDTTTELPRSTPDTVAITRLVEYGLSSMVAAEDRAKELDNRLLRHLNRADTSSNARAKALELILEKTPAFFSHPDPNVRFNAVSLLVQCNSSPVIPGSPTKAVPFNAALKALIPVVVDAKQNLETRIIAVRGLQRILRDGVNAPSTNEKSDIAEALVRMLQENPPSADDGRGWFRFVLIQALGHVDRLDNLVGQPIVVETLIQIMHDPRELWKNRAWAARSLSQLPWTAQVNAPLVTSELAKLILAMGDAYAKDQRPDVWKEPFAVAYLAFKPEGPAEAAKSWGLLFQVKRAGQNANGALVDGAFKAILPVVKPFLDPTARFAPSDLENLRKWVAANPPADRSIVPGAAPLPQ